MGRRNATNRMFSQSWPCAVRSTAQAATAAACQQLSAALKVPRRRRKGCWLLHAVLVRQGLQVPLPSCLQPQQRCSEDRGQTDRRRGDARGRGLRAAAFAGSAHARAWQRGAQVRPRATNCPAAPTCSHVVPHCLVPRPGQGNLLENVGQQQRHAALPLALQGSGRAAAQQGRCVEAKGSRRSASSIGSEPSPLKQAVRQQPAGPDCPSWPRLATDSCQASRAPSFLAAAA